MCLQLLKRLRVLEYGGYTPQRGDTSARFCALAPGACVRYLFMLCGSNPFENVQRSLLPLFMQYYPAGTSSHNMRHWGQVRTMSNSCMCVLNLQNLFGVCKPASGMWGDHLH